MKFRKKPVVIDAVRIEKEMMQTAPEWLIKAVNEGGVVFTGLGRFTQNVPFACVNTIEGTMRGIDGDWIIRGVKGELYPCKDDIFRATYEPVEEE